MIAKIIYIVGIILCIKAVLEILKMNIGTAGKVISIIVLLLTSWIGLLVYYLFAKDKLSSWFK
ncbi:MAG: hypothetical protein MJZ91_03830 [Bacteroidales bacterium]|nr:hypothetical protein [Bacteroidales bacterium]